MNSFYSFI